MTDKDLQKLAAKAGDIDHPGGEHSIYDDGRLWDCKALRWWNPLHDDGDALRLAVKLRLDVHFELNGPGMGTPIVEVMDMAKYHEAGTAFCAMQDCSEDPHAATRRAIVRAAAAIGEHHE